MDDVDWVHFGPANTDHVRQLIDMTVAYLLEGFQATGNAPLGMSIAPHLVTLMIRRRGRVVGFCAVELSGAVELIYIVPTQRRQGIAGTVLTGLQDRCPRPLKLKKPLSPAMQSLALALGIGSDEPDPREVHESEQYIEHVRAQVERRCPHRRGNRSRLCERCYRKYITAIVQGVVVCCAGLAMGCGPEEAARRLGLSIPAWAFSARA